MDDIKTELESKIQATVEADTEFQTSLVDLPEEEKTQKIDARKSEEFNKELTTLKEGSEKATKAQELADSYKVRAEKAEAALKGTAPSTAPSQDLSSKDILYLSKADIHVDDFDEVVEMAKSRKWDIKKAHEYMKPILEMRGEERKTAQATQTGASRKPSHEQSGETLLARAMKSGEVPETDEGMQALAKARMLNRYGKK